MGMKNFTIRHSEEVASVLGEAFDFDGPVLVNVMTDPNALAMPPQVEWEQMVGMFKSMYKLLLNGKGKEVIDTIRSNYKHIREVL